MLESRTMLEARDLSKRYPGVAAVSGVSFSIGAGEILGYLGPNGSGKSTTVKILTGLMEPAGGEVLYRGENIRKDLAGYKRRLGYVPEEAHLYPYLSGREYLEMTGTLRGIGEKELERKIAKLMEAFGLTSSRHSLIGTYSKGMRQKVLIMAALLHDPEVLIFDEPLSGLDVTTAAVFRNLLRTLAEAGKAILYCSHVLEVVEKVCTSVMILNRGKCVARGTVEEIRSAAAGGTLGESFAELVREPDTVKIARDVVEAIRA